MISMTACAEKTLEPANESSEARLLSNFENEYKPLEVCLTAKLGGIDTKKAADAIISGNKLPNLIDQAKQLLPSDFRDTSTVLSESVESKDKAFKLLTLMVEYRNSKRNIEPGYVSYGLLREVSAATILSNIDSVGCPQPKYLEYWARETERGDIYLNMQMESFELSKCTYGVAGKPNGNWPGIIVEANKLPELEALSARILGEGNSQLASVMLLEDPVEKAASLMYLLAQFASADRVPNESNEISIRQSLGMNGMKLIYAQAKKLDCALPNPSWHTIAETYLTEHPLSANPSPFTNNKDDTP